jgi:hypothetical protein
MADDKNEPRESNDAELAQQNLRYVHYDFRIHEVPGIARG